MPHDRNGNLIKVGDTVRVDCTVTQVHEGEEYCNASLKTVLPMYPGDSKTSLTVNTKQTEFVASAEEPAPESEATPSAAAEPETAPAH